MKNILLLILIICSASALAEGGYDTEMLKALGYDASASDLLKEGAHFLPGDQPLSIVVNGQSKGVHIIRVDSSAALCWSAPLLQTLGINPESFEKNDSSDCLKPLTDSQIQIEQQVDRSSLVLMVPVTRLLSETQYSAGGKALIINYDGRRYQYQTRTGENHNSQTLTSEVGANFNNWIFRSGQSYSSLDNRSQFTRLYSYGQRSIPGWASVVQIGEITSDDSLFSGINLLGAQIVPERDLQKGGGNRVSLNVLMSQAGTAEVWQNNVLLKTFTVTAGMNQLDEIPALNQQDDFIVKIHDQTGQVQQQSIPYIQAQSDSALVQTGSSLAVGRLRLTQQEFPLLLGSGSVYQNHRLAVMAGGLVSENYQAASWRTTLRLTERLMTSFSQTASLSQDTADSTGKKQGLSHQLSVNTLLTPTLSLTTSANFRSRDYMDAGSSWSSRKTTGQNGQIKTQYAVGLSYSQPWLGVFSFSGSQSQSWKGRESLGYMLGWGRAFGKVNVNLGIQKNRLSDDRQRSDSRYVYLNFSIPLGNSSSLRSWINSSESKTRAGIGYDSTPNDKFAWSLSSEKSQQQDASVAGSATWTNKYSQLSGGASHSESNNSFNVGARGGAVLHSEGLTFTPRKVGDTFGIISLNSAQPDVEIRTPGGKVWSDRSGHAIATWNPWQKNTVQIENQSLPKNVQIISGIADVMPYRGAVVPVILPAFTVRRALVSFPAGESPAPGSPVKNDKGMLIGFVNEDGTLFFDDLPADPLYGQLRSGNRCTLNILTPWYDEPGTLYASLSARCVP
ncbi:Outer membrane usher protein FimD/PapC [Candidatus Pantoea varia]|uniref:Outer membrane usher protein FimD/PapC n=1 Tax=Candidatus Pantoea varia TaxID=1881036 RepID=A0A1I5G8G4_9GAMM|nr:fimbria/pilus outer membrane usher protein [Pantoea varia]SFO32236.1 Outer membrane usher protein FimD/PapC [Pantoea varia]